LPVLLTFVDGYQLEVEVTPSTIVKEVYEAAVDNIGLKNFVGTAIYECLGEQGNAISPGLLITSLQNAVFLTMNALEKS
jgi:hypothetical protein